MRLRNRRRPGFVLLLVLVLLVLILGAWGVTLRQTGTLLRLESARALYAPTSEAVEIALSRGIMLLATGTPESQAGWSGATQSYSCTTVVDSPGGSQSFNVTFTKQPQQRWLVQAVAGTGDVEMPDSFSP